MKVSSWVGPILFFVGLWFNLVQLAWLGVIFFGAGVVFSLITLPVEFNASKRALGLLQTYQLADGPELKGAKAVLGCSRADLRRGPHPVPGDHALLSLDPEPPQRLSVRVAGR